MSAAPTVAVKMYSSLLIEWELWGPPVEVLQRDVQKPAVLQTAAAADNLPAFKRPGGCDLPGFFAFKRF